MRRLFLGLSLMLWWSMAPAITAPDFEFEPPRIRALLEQAWAAEHGNVGVRDEVAAASLYCEAARYGSAEGHFRSGLLHLEGPQPLRNKVLAKSFLMTAQQLGLAEAGNYLGQLVDEKVTVPGCLSGDMAYLESVRFNFRRYLVHLAVNRRQIAQLIERLAPEYGVDRGLALAIAGVESNFNSQARSPKNAMGVMQLIPETAERFGVKDPMDPVQNVRGGLAYIRWLTKHFSGDVVRVVAAYNAGEGAVHRYGGVPPYTETRAYVNRVMRYAGL